MDYKKLAECLMCCAGVNSGCICPGGWNGIVCSGPIEEDGSCMGLEGEASEAITKLLHRAEVAEARLAKAQEELDKMEQLHEDARRELGEAKARADRSKWISVDDHLPPEHESIFKKLIDEEKWRQGVEGMWQSESDDVIVSVRFADGTKKTGQARTKDGRWTGLPTIGCPIVTHWRPFPKPYNGKEGQREG